MMITKIHLFPAAMMGPKSAIPGQSSAFSNLKSAIFWTNIWRSFEGAYVGHMLDVTTDSLWKIMKE
jgi:hypothetical protein